MNDSYSPIGDPGPEDRLTSILAAYRASIPDPEPGINFTPHLWQKIERAQSVTFRFQRIARAFVTGAAALALSMALFTASQFRSQPPAYNVSYVEALADQQVVENVEYTDVAYSDLAEPDVL